MITSKNKHFFIGFFAFAVLIGGWVFTTSMGKREKRAPQIILLKDAKALNKMRKEHKIFVVFIHMEGCGPCRRLTPKFNQLARELQGEDIVFAQLEKHENKDFCKRNDIKLFPTILIFKDGVWVKEFQGCSHNSVAFFKEEINVLLAEEEEAA